MKYPKSSKHIQHLYARKNNTIQDYLHKITRYIADYCNNNGINTVVIGDITNIRKNKDMGHKTNQKFHSLPYRKIYIMLAYKLKLLGITLVKQNEAYSSQTSPLKYKVCKKNAKKSNRVNRGLYNDSGYSWNADCVGAFNILRLYLSKHVPEYVLNPLSIQPPKIIKVAV